jgi:hypothetical protein
MDRLDLLAFAGLYRTACLKCFGYPLQAPLTEAESKVLHDRIFDETGLTIGWKSIKNYSFFIFQGPSARQENPSLATLDTLARYVLEAPYASEAERRQKGDHFSWWFRYKQQWFRESHGAGRPKKTRWLQILLLGMGSLVISFILLFYHRAGGSGSFSCDFHSVNEDSLLAGGWFVKGKDTAYWNRRGEQEGHLSLFTLQGDNWPDPAHAPIVKNLLLHGISCGCFTLELHMKGFIPEENWQQAGILLLEDTGFMQKSIRISVAYNDYTGGLPKSRQIIIQAITSLGDRFGKPEEIAHVPLYSADSLDRNPILARNLENSALRIEKHGSRFRFLYSNGLLENTSFKEIASQDFAMRPKYLGLIALKGFVDSSAIIPARFSFFRLDCEDCQ